MDAFQAARLKIENCTDECACQNVHIILCDSSGDEIAVASISPLFAREVAEVMATAADVADARLLRQKDRLS